MAESPYARRIFPVWTDPATCDENQIFYQMTTHKLLICKNTGIEEVGAGGGGGTPGGINTQIQFNDGGAFAGTSGLTWNKTNNTITWGDQSALNASIQYGFAGGQQFLQSMQGGAGDTPWIGHLVQAQQTNAASNIVGTYDAVLLQNGNTAIGHAIDLYVDTAAGNPNTQVGIEVTNYAKGQGHVTTFSGNQNRILQTGAGIVIHAIDFESQGPVSITGGGSITTWSGLRVRTPLASPTTNAYGVYVEALNTLSSTNKYNIFSAGASSLNVFEGALTTGTINVNAASMTAMVVDTDTFIIDAVNNRVGIGIAPLVPLQINATTGNPTVRVQRTSPSGDSATQMDLVNDNNTGRLQFGMASTTHSVGNAAFIWSPQNIFIRFGTNNLERLRLLGNGDFGIGTTTPTKKVEINSATGDNLRLTYNDADGSAANYADLLVSSGGNLTITPSGGNTNITGTINGVKVYRALLTQTSTNAPTATVLENSLGGTVVWTRSVQGVYVATLTGAFPSGKTMVTMGAFPASQDGVVYGYTRTDNTITLSTIYFRVPGGTQEASDGMLSETAIEILVYP